LLSVLRRRDRRPFFSYDELQMPGPEKHVHNETSLALKSRLSPVRLILGISHSPPLRGEVPKALLDSPVRCPQTVESVPGRGLSFGLSGCL